MSLRTTMGKTIGGTTALAGGGLSGCSYLLNHVDREIENLPFYKEWTAEFGRWMMSNHVPSYINEIAEHPETYFYVGLVGLGIGINMYLSNLSRQWKREGRH